jgi:transcription factor IIIB 90 kDa subunit
MHNYIASLANRLGHPGLIPRVQLLFDQAMHRGKYRWGKKARLVAGACLAIALREAHKGDTLKDIAVR